MTWLRHLLRILAWSLLPLLGLAMLGYLTLALMNLHDQPPSARVLEWRRQIAERPPLADKDNGYVFLLGFSTAQDQNPFAAGHRQLDALRRLGADPGFDIGRLPDMPYLDRSSRSEAVATLARHCQMPAADCLLSLSRSPQTLRQWVDDEQWLLARYRTLIALPGWQEHLPIDLMANLPAFHDVFEGQKLLLARAHLLAAKGELTEARALLEEDATFWRRRLADTEHLVTKMLVASALQRHLLWTHMITRGLPRERMQEVVARQWQMPLSREELSLRRVLVSEWAFADRLVHDLDRDSRRIRVPAETTAGEWTDRLSRLLQRPLLQPQDASNRHAELLGDLAEALERVNFENFSASYAAARNVEVKTLQSHRRLRPYNLVHHLFLARAFEPHFHTYWVRAGDIEGLRRAMLLSLELRRRGVAAAGFGRALRESALRNPYTDEPFQWDDNAGGIVFHGRREGEAGRYLLVY
jgi:hypothetical protein